MLTGGASRRMGTDKALVEIDGLAMAARVARALRTAGATEVVCVGGDLRTLAALGLDARPDRHPGAGPLGGVLTALALSANPTVVAAPCDLLSPDAAAFTALLRALDADPAALAASPSPTDPLPVALRRRALPALVRIFDHGERSLHRAFAALPHVAAPLAAGADADGPGDLAGWHDRDGPQDRRG